MLEDVIECFQNIKK